MSTTAKRLRELLGGPAMVVAPFVYDCLQARLAEQTGFDAVYMTGFGTAAARGFPDLGLLTMSEMVQNVRAIAHAVKIPVICDADTGYGNPLNVARTVREYEEAGAAALHIEDQVFPKKCGFLAGKQVIPLDQMVPKVRAACDARRDRDFVIIARTDALAVNGWDDVVQRTHAYRAAGADLIFVDGIRTLEDLKNYATRLGDLPLLYNGALLPVPELARYGFKLTLHISSLIASYVNFRDGLRELKDTGAMKVTLTGRLFEELTDLLGVPEAEALAKKYSDS
ncbi:MAG TPA: isocitrate lyase/PEP mutase family protein [Candidatus Binataceae bacterium]|nr:isocitrate lyase/PEP mutase family protein [Candidatus Binataceae bacterium]